MTWSVLRVIAKYPSKFSNIKALHIEYDNRYHEEIMQIPDELMINVVDLAIEDKSIGSDPSNFMAAAQCLIEKTRCLTHLKLAPLKKNIEWIRLLAENAPKLRFLDSLSINADFPIEIAVAEEQAIRPAQTVEHYM